MKIGAQSFRRHRKTFLMLATLLLVLLLVGATKIDRRIWADGTNMTRLQFADVLFCQRVSQAVNDSLGNGMADGSDCVNRNLYVSTSAIGNIQTLNIVPPEGGFGDIDWEGNYISISGGWARAFYNLTSLSITNMHVRDISPLQNISGNLTYLDLSNNKINDVSALGALKDKLVYLDISNNPVGSTGFDKLSEFTELTTLKLVNIGLGDFGILFQPVEPEYDDETGEPLTEPESSSNLAKVLRILDISNNESVSCEKVGESSCEESLEELSNYADDLIISELYASNDNLDASDLPHIASLRNLEKLDVSNNHIGNFSAIKSKELISLKADSQIFKRAVNGLDYRPLPQIFTQAGQENYFERIPNAPNTAVALDELNLDNAQFYESNVRFVNAVIASESSRNPHPATVSIPDGTGAFENSRLEVYFTGQIVSFNDVNLCNSVYAQGAIGTAFYDINGELNLDASEGPVVITNACNTSKQIALIPEGSSKFLRLTLDSINGGEETDLTGLEEFYNIEVLSLNNNGLTNIDQLEDLTQVKHLWLNDNNLDSYNWTTITNYLTSLQILYLNNNNMSEISTDLANLTRLANLYLVNNGISDVVPLAQASRLTVLDLSENNLITDFSGMIQEESKCNPSLLKLENAGVISIPDAWIMNEFSNLASLNLNGNQITDDTIANLAFAQRLDELYLNNNQITSTSGFSDITNLKKLFLDGNQITDVSGLSSLSRLAELHLSNNQIKNITGLNILPSLATLDLKNQTLTGTTSDTTGAYNLPAVFSQATTLSFPTVTGFQSAGNYTIVNGTMDYDEMIATMIDKSEEMTVTIPDGSLAGTTVTVTYSPEVEEFTWNITNNTGDGATIATTSANSFTVTSDKACMVLWTSDNGQTWNRLNSSTVPGNNNMRAFDLEQVTSGAEIVVAYIGDVDGNNTLNVLDARAIVYHILEKTSLSKEQEKIADVDGNNTLNVLDARAIIYDILDKAKINW